MRIVTIGGGTGQFHMLQALRTLRSKQKESIVLTAIPTTSDSGGSSGYLRLESNVIAPGDISQCLFGLHPEPKLVEPLFGHRFKNGFLKGHTPRNMIVMAYFERYGVTQEAMDSMREVFHLDGSIAPVTFTPANLHARLYSGKELGSESEINGADLLSEGGVEKLWLDPVAEPNPAALAAIEEADVIIVCPGTLVCSIIPNFLVPSVTETLKRSSAKKIHIVNLMNRRGHEPADWSVLDHVACLEQYLGEGFFDHIICNTEPLSVEQQDTYQEEKMAVTAVPKSLARGSRVMAVPLLSHEVITQDASDAIAHTRSFVRHDPVLVVAALETVLRLA